MSNETSRGWCCGHCLPSLSINLLDRGFSAAKTRCHGGVKAVSLHHALAWVAEDATSIFSGLFVTRETFQNAFQGRGHAICVASKTCLLGRPISRPRSDLIHRRQRSGFCTALPQENCHICGKQNNDKIQQYRPIFNVKWKD